METVMKPTEVNVTKGDVRAIMRGLYPDTRPAYDTFCTVLRPGQTREVDALMGFVIRRARRIEGYDERS